jgi:hypothetical protein
MKKRPAGPSPGALKTALKYSEQEQVLARQARETDKWYGTDRVMGDQFLEQFEIPLAPREQHLLDAVYALPPAGPRLEKATTRILTPVQLPLRPHPPYSDPLKEAKGLLPGALPPEPAQWTLEKKATTKHRREMKDVLQDLSPNMSAFVRSLDKHLETLESECGEQRAIEDVVQARELQSKYRQLEAAKADDDDLATRFSSLRVTLLKPGGMSAAWKEERKKLADAYFKKHNTKMPPTVENQAFILWEQTCRQLTRNLPPELKPTTAAARCASSSENRILPTKLVEWVFQVPPSPPHPRGPPVGAPQSEGPSRGPAGDTRDAPVELAPAPPPTFAVPQLPLRSAPDAPVISSAAQPKVHPAPKVAPVPKVSPPLPKVPPAPRRPNVGALSGSGGKGPSDAGPREGPSDWGTCGGNDHVLDIRGFPPPPKPKPAVPRTTPFAPVPACGDQKGWDPAGPREGPSDWGASGERGLRVGDHGRNVHGLVPDIWGLNPYVATPATAPGGTTCYKPAGKSADDLLSSAMKMLHDD